MNLPIEQLLYNNSIKYNEETPYIYENCYVPRVTSILSSMLHEDYLMNWSNYIGLYKHKKYKDVLNLSADVGTYTHQAIENYLQNGISLDISTVPVCMQQEVYNTFHSFLMWWDIILQHNIKILKEEYPLVCKYFGGTLDLLLEIDGKIYIVDFKTSNHLSYKYFLQLSAYRYMLRVNENIEVDGVIILQLSKTNHNFNEQILVFENTDHLQYMNACEQCFLSLVYAFYNRYYVENTYKSIIL